MAHTYRITPRVRIVIHNLHKTTFFRERDKQEQQKDRERERENLRAAELRESVGVTITTTRAIPLDGYSAATRIQAGEIRMLREIEPAARQTPRLGLLLGGLLLLLLLGRLLGLLLLVLVGAGRGGRRADSGGRWRWLGGQGLEDGVHLVRHGLKIRVAKSEMLPGEF